MKKLFTKIYLTYVLLLLVVASTMGVYYYNLILDNYQQRLEDNLTNINYILQEKFKGVNSGYNNILTYFLHEQGNTFQYRITIVDLKGVVKADSHEDYKRMSNHKLRPEILKAINNEKGFVRRYSKTIKKEMLYLALPLKYPNGNNKAILRISTDTDKMSAVLKELNFELVSFTIFILLISFAISYYMTKKIVSPIEQLSTASKLISSGDFNINLETKGNDELNRLKESFNFMAMQLNELFSKVSSQKDELNTIISSIDEALVVIDYSQKIVYSNDSFNQMVSNTPYFKKDLVFHLNENSDSSVDEILKNVKIFGKSLTFNFSWGGQYYIVAAYSIKSKNEIVLLFHNMTEMNKLEKIKRDFVINVSHELRTPLTSISGFIEMLELEVSNNDDAKKYIGIINRNTDRLISLVNDLLVLAEVENPNEIDLNFEKFDIVEIVENVLKMFENKIESKKLDLIFKKDEDLSKINADRNKIEQLFVNLVSNAIKYTNTGKIDIILYQKQNYIIFEINDTGIGIPEKDLNRIFERFYMVDKSRSRMIGSTGLGLAIVKHIVNSHNGEIKINSILNEGTRIIVKLPLDKNQLSI